MFPSSKRKKKKIGLAGLLTGFVLVLPRHRIL